MLDRPAKAIFGTPGSIDAATLFKLPLPMQAEGVRLLFEMGQTMSQVQVRIGLSAREIRQLVELAQTFRRSGDTNLVAKGV
ncbi:MULTISPECIES: hypothetical protein [unclassified Mesorhizobium]|uniref:hypothetical protein n=1 Tax=unclassified Mesorhizobium TaxID=325217 RepID=UPI00241506C9|nr:MULTISPECIES: hypothetical protein [unclassified Mesorhizobium]MDG4854569.1 hypothetical protein [Mesorhizobium sp. WSM4982]MDG4916108.1 hypothetical protein [Mesorhizobium sp. WSM4983]